MKEKIIKIDAEPLKGFLIPITECKHFEGIGDCKESKGLCVDNDSCYFKQLKRLQEENKELKKQLSIYMSQYEIKIPNKYRQALEEIKKWATNHNPCDIEPEINCTKEDCFDCLNYDIKKITKIIDEALNDRD